MARLRHELEAERRRAGMTPDTLGQIYAASAHLTTVATEGEKSLRSALAQGPWYSKDSCRYLLSHIMAANRDSALNRALVAQIGTLKLASDILQTVGNISTV